LFRAPTWGITFGKSADPGEIVASRILPGSVAEAAGVKPGDRFVALERSRDDARLDVRPSFLMKYRAEVDSYHEWQAVLADKVKLWDFQTEDVRLVRADGEKIFMPADRRMSFIDLPIRYYLVAVLSLATLAVAVGILAFAPAARNAILAAMAGIFLSGVLLYQVLVSPIQLALSPLMLDLLFYLGGAGALFYTFTTTAMIWHTPDPPARFPFTTVWFLAAGFILISNRFSLVTFPFNPYIFPMLVANAVGLLLLGVQIVRSRNDPVDRATMSWFTLSLLAGGLPYLLLVMTPRAFNLPPLIPVEGGALLLTLTWGGFVFGTLRYRLFSIQAAWFGTMLWLSLVGIFVVADIALLLLFGLSNVQAITIAAAVSSWLLFPLKSLFLDHLMRRNLVRSDEAALAFVDLVGTMDEPREMDGRFLRFAQTLFEAESAEIDESAADETVSIQDRGLSLRYPAITREGSVILRGRSHGRRLFTPNDAGVLRLLCKMARRMFEQRRHQDARRLEDRNRIARDLHDHLGAKLLNLLFSAPKDSQARSEAVSAIDALRESIMVLEDSEELDLETCVRLIWSEQAQRLEASGFTLVVESGFELSRVIDSRVFVNLKNIIGEFASNVIKYGDRQRPVTCSTVIDGDGTLRVSVANHAKESGSDYPSGGRGIHNIATRAAEIGATVQVLRNEDPDTPFIVELTLPLAV
ncbi:MAG: hypothetical protein VYD64_00620, partial [Pseudomonadota bacterium]|nr:hypothetical protein [Pseudomonadota bacterium]